jgi:acetyl esterase/lipase
MPQAPVRAVHLLQIAACALAMTTALPSRAEDPARLMKMPVAAPAFTLAFGNSPLQQGELRVPEGKGPFPVAILVHGGCFLSGAPPRLMAPLATQLAEHGIASWNLDYRALGDAGGGWPGTFQDWGAGADALRQAAAKAPLDLSRVVVVGHSAGATAAAWIANRHHIPKDSPLAADKPLEVQGAVLVDGPPDLRPYLGRDVQICDEPVLERLLGGSPSAQPSHWHAGNPAELLPLGLPQVVISDAVLDAPLAHAYEKAARSAGDRVTVIDFDDHDHFAMLMPDTPTGKKLEQAIVDLVGSLKPKAAP